MTAGGALLGLDPGERRIGVALAVSGTTLAVPLATIERTPGWVEEVKALAEHHGAAGLVIGLPVSLDGVERAAAQGARVFAAEVGSAVGLPVHLVDERLSTTAAHRALAAAGAGSRRRKATVDRSAAAMILQTYLDGVAGGAGA